MAQSSLSGVTGNHILLQSIRQTGTQFIIGNPGTTELSWLDILAEYPEIQYLLALHEDIAVSIADGYAQASGRVGVASVHTTPGTTHALGNLFNAQVSGTPLVLLIGQQDQRLLLREPFLASDLERIVQTYTKWSWTVRRLADLPLAVYRAFKAAWDPPQGPVALIVPRDIYEETIPTQEWVYEINHVSIPATLISVPNPKSLEASLTYLRSAKRAALVIGPSMRHREALNDLLQLATEVGIGIYSDPRYAPVVSPDHPNYIGPIDLWAHEPPEVLLVVQQKAFLERMYHQVPIIPRETKTIYIHDNAFEIGKNHPATVGLWGQPEATCRELLMTARNLREPLGSHDDMRHHWILSRHQHFLAQRDGNASPAPAQSSSGIDGKDLAIALAQGLPANTAVIIGATSHSGFFRDYLPTTPSMEIYAEPGGVLGWAPAAAIGVKLANPDRPVVAIVGDGNFLYYPQALWTAQRYQLPIVTIICNNHSYLNDKVQLAARKGPMSIRGDYSVVDLENPSVDFLEIGQAFGALVRRVQATHELQGALDWALQQHQSVLLDVPVNPWQARGG